MGLPRWLSGKESTCQCKRCRRLGSDPWVRTSPLFLPGASRGQESLVGCSTWGCKESDMIARLSTHSCMYELDDQQEPLLNTL